MLRQALGKRAATFDRQRQITDDFLQGRVPLLFFENAQSAQQRQTRVHERGQLPGKGREHLRFHPAAQPGNVDGEVHRGALPAGFLGGLGLHLLVGLPLDLIDLDDLGGEQAHFLDPTDGLVLVGDFERSLGFLAPRVHCHVIVLRHNRSSRIFHDFFNSGITLEDASQAVFPKGDHAQFDRLLPQNNGWRTLVDQGAYGVVDRQ